MGIKYLGLERRHFKRVRVSLNVMVSTEGPLEVQIQNEKGQFAATMIDLCEGGLAIMTAAQLDVPSLIWIKFTLLRPNGNSVSYEFFGQVEILGEVRSAVPINENFYRVGISFMQIDEGCRQDIAHFIEIIGSGAAAGSSEHN